MDPGFVKFSGRETLLYTYLAAKYNEELFCIQGRRPIRGCVQKRSRSCHDRALWAGGEYFLFLFAFT
jgi:hypothetical protein